MGTLPTVDTITNILSDTVENLKKHAHDRNILLWYQDRYLPVIHGLEYWGPKYRHYRLPTDKEPMSQDKKERILCTVSSEAFGLMIYENCREKWQNIMKLKKKNRGKLSLEICVMCLKIIATNITILPILVNYANTLYQLTQELKSHVQELRPNHMKPSGHLQRKDRRSTEVGRRELTRHTTPITC